MACILVGLYNCNIYMYIKIISVQDFLYNDNILLNVFHVMSDWEKNKFLPMNQ